MLTLVLAAGCGSDGEDRVEPARADQQAASGEEAQDVVAAFDAWAKGDDSGSENSDQIGGSGSNSAAAGTSGTVSDGVTEQFNRKVRTCWKQPFGMPRLAKVRLLVQFNPDGTVRDVTPRPEASEAVRYRTETPFLVMIAQTTRALRECQPYQIIRRNFPEYSQIEMVVDPRTFRN